MIEKTLCLDVTNQPLEDINNFCIINDTELIIESDKAYIPIITTLESLTQYLGIDTTKHQ